VLSAGVSQLGNWYKNGGKAGGGAAGGEDEGDEDNSGVLSGSNGPGGEPLESGCPRMAEKIHNIWWL
jgi:hypothetical protein